MSVRIDVASYYANKQIFNELYEYVANEFFAVNSAVIDIEFGPLEIIYFSICFWVNSVLNA